MAAARRLHRFVWRTKAANRTAPSRDCKATPRTNAACGYAFFRIRKRPAVDEVVMTKTHLHTEFTRAPCRCFQQAATSPSSSIRRSAGAFGDGLLFAVCCVASCMELCLFAGGCRCDDNADDQFRHLPVLLVAFTDLVSASVTTRCQPRLPRTKCGVRSSAPPGLWLVPTAGPSALIVV